MNDPADPEFKRLETLARAARSAANSPNRAELEQGLRALRARLVAARRSFQLTLRVAIFAGTLLASLALLALLFPLRKTARLAERSIAVTTVAGGQILEGGYLSESGGHGIRIEFDEGSQVELTRGTRGRLGAVTALGARLLLDQGTATLRITPNPAHRWTVEAGPFVVSVRGTDFTVVWDPAAEELDVELRKGRVAVTGPVAGDELVLRPGQSLSVNLPKRETVIREARGDPAPSSSPAPPVASSSAAPSLPTPPRTTPPRELEAPHPSTQRHWREALASGHWDIILADAERDGIEQSLKTLSSDELIALADAARYRQRPSLARAALLAVKQRFPNSSRAVDALFLLGRVEELRPNGKSAALERYEEYLAGAPSGTYAAEALGRKLILLKETAGPESARRVATEYLLRFPNGSYAEAARALQR
jgi:ferric-dicitrate binding protein FerR (iron transport regulator)